MSNQATFAYSICVPVPLSLELINLGPLDIALYPSMPICQLIIEQVSGIPFRNDSQFQNQARPGGGR